MSATADSSIASAYRKYIECYDNRRTGTTWRVGVVERRADGNVRIRTNTMLEGWTRIEALKDISAKGWY